MSDMRTKNNLLLNRKNAWEDLSDDNRTEISEFSNDYKAFLDKARTERLSAQEIIKIAKAYGFKDSNSDTGNKLYFLDDSGKMVAVVYKGMSSMEKGVNILFSHIDSPCLHLKQIPIREDSNSSTVVFKTHYYGGIKKYQWVSRPLAIVGVVSKANGEIIDVSIGLDKEDPVFVIPDLLPHLSRKVQGDKKIADAIPGERLNALVGSIPIDDKRLKQKIKLNVLGFLYTEYGITEEDFISAELMLVPADDVRDVGFDRSMTMGYGHDDKSCAYASLRAVCDLKEMPDRTSVIFFFDKEEIGSEGDTSANSNFVEYVLAVLQDNGDSVSIKQNLNMLRSSRFISADVGAGVNPNWPEPHDMINAAKIGYGVCVTKFTGSGGKYMANDASAETVGLVRQILNKEDIRWQYEELGKVDEGGGGTMAMLFSKRGMKGLDVGLAVLSMHAPSEIISKVDHYELYRFYRAFLVEE